jgi:hypothetical protein
MRLEFSYIYYAITTSQPREHSVTINFDYRCGILEAADTKLAENGVGTRGIPRLPELKMASY